MSKGGLIFEVEVLLGNGEERVFEVLAASEQDALDQAWDVLERYGPVEINPTVLQKVAA